MRRPGERRNEPGGDHEYPQEFSYNERDLYAGTTPYNAYEGLDPNSVGGLGQQQASPSQVAEAYAQGMYPYSGGPLSPAIYREEAMGAYSVPGGGLGKVLLWGGLGALAYMALTGKFTKKRRRRKRRK